MGDQIYTPVMQVFTSDGDPGVGYKLYTYESGTTTPKTVYTDEACTVAATNPVVFDSRGEATIYYADEYKFVLKTDADVTVWTVDSVGTAATSSSTTYAYYPDPDEADQGVTAAGTGDTIYDFVTALGVAEYGKIVLRHNGVGNTTEYTLDTDIDLTLYPFLFIEVQPGAVLVRTTGDEVLTLPNPSHFIVADDQKITAVDMLAFDEPGTVYPEWWGALGDDSTDDSSPAQYAISAMGTAGGGVVQFLSKTYLLGNLELKSYVTVRGVGLPGYASYSLGTRNSYQTILHGNAAGDVIGTPTTTVKGACVEYISFRGPGSGTATKGLYLDDSDRGTFRYLTFDNFDDQAIRIDEGNANEFYRIFAQNCLIDKTRAAKIGVIDVGASTDNYFDKIEATASSSSLSSGDMYICAFAFNNVLASNNFVSDCVGEVSDIGFYIVGDTNRFTGCRADLNYAHGFQLTANAAGNTFVNCHANRNSAETTNTYNGFEIPASTSNNYFVGCVAHSVAADGFYHKYGFHSALASASTSNKFTGCGGSAAATALFNGSDYLGDSFTIEGVFDFTADDATPSVQGGNVFHFNSYTGATDITDFDDGTPNQIIHVKDYEADGYITIKNNANIVTSTGGDINIAQNVWYTFIHDNGVWRSMT